MDLPLKSQDAIHKFFDESRGKEFIHFQSMKLSNYTLSRFDYYHFLQPFARTHNAYMNRIISYIDRILVEIQKIIGIKRNNGQFILQKGSNWFSITHELAQFVVKKRKWILNNYKFTSMPDESFLQTLVINSKFKKHLYYQTFTDTDYSCLRKTDWIRGTPYIWRKEDFDELINSGLMFARKIDENVDDEIINKIFNHIRKDRS